MGKSMAAGRINLFPHTPPHLSWSEPMTSKKEGVRAQSCPTLCDSRDCGPPGPSVHGISQARILEWVAISFYRGIFPTKGSTWNLNNGQSAN